MLPYGRTQNVEFKGHVDKLNQEKEEQVLHCDFLNTTILEF